MAGEAEKLFKDLGEKIEQLIEKAKHASADVREEMKEPIEKLKKERDKLEKKMVDFRDKNEPKIEEAKHHLKTAIDEMSKAFEKMFRKGPGAEEYKD